MGIANDALATTRAAFGADYPLTHVVRYFTAECLIANDRFADARALLGGLDREKMAQLLGNPEIGAAIDLALAETALGSGRSEEHTSELQSLMRISYAVFCLKKKNN